MVVNGNSEKLSQNSYTIKDGIKDVFSGFNIIILQAVAALTVFVVYIAIQYKRSDTLMLHIIFCTVGYALLMSCPIILFAGENFFGRSLTRYHKSIIHAVFIGAGSVFAIAGMAIEIDSKNKADRSHFKSTHGLTGFISLILTLLACCIGGLAIQIQTIHRIIPFIKPIWWKILHNSLGLFAFIIGMVSLCYGYETGWFRRTATYEQKVAAIAVTSIITGWSVISPVKTLFGYCKTAFGR